MKNNKFWSIKSCAVVASVSLLSIASAHAEVTLKVDDNIKVTAINGKAYNTSLFQSIKKDFTLQPGKHVITAKYDRLYELRGDDHDYLRSGNITLTADLMDNQTYKLVMPGQPEDYRDARKYAESPSLAVMKGSTVVAQAQGASENGGILSGITSMIGVGSDAQAENQQAIAAINNSNQNSNTYSTNNTNAIPAVSNPTTTSDNTLDQFMQLWLQASPEEREKIRQWIK